jgi:hypothetical protein
LTLLYSADLIRARADIKRNEPEESRLRAIGEAIRARLSHEDIESLAAAGRSLDAPAAVAYAASVANHADGSGA